MIPSTADFSACRVAIGSRVRADILHRAPCFRLLRFLPSLVRGGPDHLFPVWRVASTGYSAIPLDWCTSDHARYVLDAVTLMERGGGTPRKEKDYDSSKPVTDVAKDKIVRYGEDHNERQA